MKKTILITCLVALLAAPAMAQVDLSNYVALGDSLTAGFASGALMDFYQDRSYPAILAAQAEAAGFEQPLVSEPGLPPILELVHLVPVPVLFRSHSGFAGQRGSPPALQQPRRTGRQPLRHALHRRRHQ